MMAAQKQSVQSAPKLSQSATVLQPDFDAAMIDAQREVALAKMYAFDEQCFRFGDMLIFDPTRRADVADFLYYLATANGLVFAHGDGLIHNIIVAGISGGAE